MARPEHTSDICLLLNLSTSKGWKAELAWLADLQRTVYPHKWSPVSCRSGAGQEKFAGKGRRSTAVITLNKVAYSNTTISERVDRCWRCAAYSVLRTVVRPVIKCSPLHFSIANFVLSCMCLCCRSNRWQSMRICGKVQPNKKVSI